MGSPKAPKAPTPPDPAKVAAAQTKQNIDTALANFELNAIDQETPYGSYRYVLDEQNPYKIVNGQQLPNYKLVQEFSPEMQGLFDQRVENQGALGDLTGTAIEGLGDIYDNPDFGTTPSDYNFSDLYDPESSATGVGDALLGRLEPGLQSDEERLIASLENRGIHRGSSLWKRALRENSVNKQEARATATIRGAAEDRATAGLRANLKNMGLQHRSSDRAQRVNEVLALLGASKGDQAQYISPYSTNIADTDVAGITNAVHQGNLQQYQTDVQARSSLIGGLLGFGGSALGALF